MATSYSCSRSSPSGSYNKSHTDSDSDKAFARKSPDSKFPSIPPRKSLHLKTDDKTGGYNHPHMGLSHYSHPIYEPTQTIDHSLLYEIATDSNSSKASGAHYRVSGVSPSRSERRRLSSVDSDGLSAISTSSPTQSLQHMAMQAMSASTPMSLGSASRDQQIRSGGPVSQYARTSSLPSTSPLPIPVRSYLPRQHSVSSESPVLHFNTSRDSFSSNSLPAHCGGPSPTRESLPSIQDIFGEDQLYPPPFERPSRHRGSASRVDASPISPSLYGTSPHSLSISTTSSYHLSSSQPTYAGDSLQAADNTAASLALDINQRMRLTSPSNSSVTPTKPAEFRCNFEGCKTQPFSTQYLLTSHMNVHSSSRPHYCPFAGCPRAEGGEGFKRKNEMTKIGNTPARTICKGMYFRNDQMEIKRDDGEELAHDNGS
ncbi:hypothetical protein HOO65_110005 [Ceratocystis lukuohia]|uniref:C2H2-type domain-containing protein n=1 Tax=Ceratocystis lukuohia TaxID=2019550 RepID=A0ABR4M8C7_9PEZI